MLITKLLNYNLATAILHGQLKSHKNNIPCRQIVPYMNASANNLWKYLKQALKSYITLNIL